MRVRQDGPRGARQGTGRQDTSTGGIGYDLPQKWNRALLDDNGSLEMRARPDIRRLRRGYSDIVGGTAELKMAGKRLHAAARKNALSVRRGWKGAKRNDGRALVDTIKMERDTSLNGGLVDYVIFSDHPAIMSIEFGFRPSLMAAGRPMRGKHVKGHFVLTNAAKNLPAVKVRQRGKRRD